MLDIIKTAVNKQQYAGPDTGNLMASVKKVVLVLGPRSLMSVGYGDKGEIFAIRYCDYNNVSSDWIGDFYEHQFITEPLLADEEKISAVFISTDRTMLVPASLYNSDEAASWLRKLHLVENDDVVSDYKLGSDEAYLVYAWPQMLQDLIKRYFSKAQTFSINAAQLNRSFKNNTVVQCNISIREAAITVYKGNKLQASETIYYNTAEDIAYRIQYLCKSNNIHDAQIRCTATSSELMLIIGRLTQYFPELTIGDGDGAASQSAWEGPVSLSRQLYKCVS